MGQAITKYILNFSHDSRHMPSLYTESVQQYERIQNCKFIAPPDLPKIILYTVVPFDTENLAYSCPRVNFCENNWAPFCTLFTNFKILAFLIIVFNTQPYVHRAL